MQPWLDKEDLMTGVDWDQEIRRAIREADFVLICFSSHVVVKRGYIQREIRFALDSYNDLPPGQVLLLPVRLEECVVPQDIGRYEYTDLFQQDGYARLTRSILSHWMARRQGLEGKSPGMAKSAKTAEPFRLAFGKGATQQGEQFPPRNRRLKTRTGEKVRPARHPNVIRQGPIHRRARHSGCGDGASSFGSTFAARLGIRSWPPCARGIGSDSLQVSRRPRGTPS
jgi:hypothetical protein